MADCGFTICTTARECEIGFTGLASGDDPKFSPDGSIVSFIRDHGLAVIRSARSRHADAVSLHHRRIPARANGQVFLNGEVDWVYEEELDVRSNYFWSPDSKNIAYLQMNETQVPQYPLTDWIPDHAMVEWQRYPQPGDANPEVHVGVVSARGGKTTWMKLPIHEGDDYIPRFGWVDHKTLWIETLSRDHKHRALYFADAEYGDARQMLEISDEKFLDENYDVAVGDGAIVLHNWSDGHNQLYLYSYNKAKPLAADAKLDAATDQGRFRSRRCIPRRHCAQSGGLRVERGQSAGAADLAGELRWRAQAIERRRGISSRPLSAPDGSAFTDKFSTRMQPPVMRHLPGVRPGRGVCSELPRLLGDARARFLPSARAGAA